jgi:hypothetical protein
MLQTAISEGRSITLGTKSTAGDGLYGSHAYIVTGYDATSDTFSVYNPWGYSHPGPLSWTQLQANCSSFVVTNPSGSVGNNLSSVRSSTSETFVGNWTVVLVRDESVRDTDGLQDEPENHAPFASILASELKSGVEFPSVEIASPQDAQVENNESSTKQLAPPLSANLVDLAMSHLVQKLV